LLQCGLINLKIVLLGLVSNSNTTNQSVYQPVFGRNQYDFTKGMGVLSGANIKLCSSACGVYGDRCKESTCTLIWTLDITSGAYSSVATGRRDTNLGMWSWMGLILNNDAAPHYLRCCANMPNNTCNSNIDYCLVLCSLIAYLTQGQR